MPDHPCHQHCPGHHTGTCLTGACGFCGTILHSVASGECRACLRIVCESCDGGYQPDLGPICSPCTPPSNSPATGNLGNSGEAEPHRLCVLELDLACGHVVTVALTGWYPVTVSCCDRLGGTIRDSIYVAYDSRVDFVRLQSERYEVRPKGTRPAPIQIIGRRARTDAPYQPPCRGISGSAGRFPSHVGATWSLDNTLAAAENA